VCVQLNNENLYSCKRCDKALVKIIACECNVRAELRPPIRDLLRERGPQHGVERAVSHLYDIRIMCTYYENNNKNLYPTIQLRTPTCAHEEVCDARQNGQQLLAIKYIKPA